jgi:hypothetical protein
MRGIGWSLVCELGDWVEDLICELLLLEAGMEMMG